MAEDRLFNKPKRINWKIIAGSELHPIQMYDVVFDEKDYLDRQLEVSPSMSFKRPPGRPRKVTGEFKIKTGSMVT